MIRGIAAIPYLLPIGSAALGLFALLKDWHAYKHPRHRWAVAVVIGLVLTFALIRQYKDDSDRRIDKEKQSEAAKRLQLELVAANEGQRESFTKLSQMIARLPQSCRPPDVDGLVEQLAEKLRPKHYEVGVTENLQMKEGAVGSKTPH